MSIDNGGPAFPSGRMDQYGPQGEAIREGYAELGMSLRDWFAGQALAVLAKDEWIYGSDNEGPDVFDEATCMSIGSCAYQMADAMLRARKRRQT
jgi:hypothetical protein